MRKLSASMHDKDMLFGFDSNPDGMVEPRTNWNYMFLGPRAYMRNAGPIAGITLIIKRDGTVLVEKFTHHGLPGVLSSKTKSELLRYDLFEEVKAILVRNEYTLNGHFSCASWMGWPLTIAYNGHLSTLDLEEYTRGENNLKPMIRKLIPLLQEASIAVLPGDFFC